MRINQLALNSVLPSCPLYLRVSSSLVVALVTLLGAGGCGGGGQSSGRPDLDATPEADRRAAATKAELYVFCAKVKKRGANAAKQDLPDLLESLAAYEKLKLGAHQETYKQIVEKLKALQSLIGGSPAKPALDAAVEEIKKLAEKLPGNADANPQVE
jgi:hypothetical protein